MKATSFVLMILALAPAPAVAGQINGIIQHTDGRSLANTAIQIKCGDDIKDGRIEGDGRYSIFVPKTGACHLIVGNHRTRIFSGRHPARYDFWLSNNGLSRR